MADHYCVRFLETSAKDSKNVEQAFTLMTREIKNRVAVTQPKKNDNTPSGNVKVGGGSAVPQQKKDGCC